MSHRWLTAIGLCLVACGTSVVGPDLLGRSDPIPGIDVSLRVRSSTMAPGDTVFFEASAFNATADDIRLSENCGPVFDVVVFDPTGRQRSVLADLLGPNGAFTCEGGERFVAEPGETETETLWWINMGLAGEYSAVAALRWNSGLRHHSSPSSFRVR